VLDKETRDVGGSGGGSSSGGGEQDEAAQSTAEAAARERAEKEKEMRAEKLKMMDQLKELTRRKQELLQQQIDKQKSLLRLAEKVKPTTVRTALQRGAAGDSCACAAICGRNAFSRETSTGGQ
jgi:hypothetical protein